MASHLDLEEQEQLEQLKAFWSRWGNLITWLLTAALAVFAAYVGWNRWQDSQALAAEQIYGSLESAYNAANGGAADPAKVASIWGDLQDKYPRTNYASQGGLLAARLQADSGKPEDARKTLAWVGEHGSTQNYRDVANLRLAALAMDAKQLDAAGKALDAVKGPEFEALVADRRGDLALLANKPGDAKTQFEKAYAALAAGAPYKQLLGYKLASLGVTVAADTGAAR